MQASHGKMEVTTQLAKPRGINYDSCIMNPRHGGPPSTTPPVAGGAVCAPATFGGTYFVAIASTLTIFIRTSEEVQSDDKDLLLPREDTS